MGDREILETYLNSGPKNTSETDIFPHGPKSLLTSVIDLINLQNTRLFTACTKARTHFFSHLIPQIHCCASQLALFGKLLVPQLAKKYQKIFCKSYDNSNEVLLIL